MLSAETIRSLLPVLFGLPLVAALIVKLFGQKQSQARSLALVFALVHLGLTVDVILSAYLPLNSRPLDPNPVTRHSPIFLPEFVPGDPGSGHKASEIISFDADSHTTTYNLLRFSDVDATGALKNPKMKSIQFFIGLDGLNVWMLGLTSLIMLSIVLVSWSGIQENAGSFYAWIFALQAGAIGVFLAFDIILFYVCFELTLIPLFFLIGNWGVGPTRREAARKLFLYTLGGGLITLVGIAGAVLMVYNHTGILTFSIPELSESVSQMLSKADGNTVAGARTLQIFLFLALAVGFAVKIPLVPLHTWLPGAYSEAPIGVTVMLSAILAKMGTFGLLRICLPLAPDATLVVGVPLLGVMGAVGIVYGAFCAFAQSDFKKLVAYSSVSHLGFVALALVAFNHEGMSGGMLHMVNHGLSTGAMFILVGLLIDRYGTTRIVDYSGMWAKLPKLTFFMMVIALASVGLPGLNNFISEMLMLFGLFDLRNANVTTISFGVVGGFGIFLSAWYTLTLVQRVFFGPLREPAPAVQGAIVKDLNRREYWAIAPLALGCLLLGIFPQVILTTMDRDIKALTIVADEARHRADHGK